MCQRLRVPVECRGIERRQLAEQMFGKRRIRASAPATEAAEHVDVRSFEVNDRREIVRQIDRRDIVPTARELGVIARVEHRPPRKAEVARGQRRSVGPRDAMAKM